MTGHRRGVATIAIGAPEPPPGGWPAGMTPPVFGSVSYELDADAYADIARTDGVNTWWYTRLRNPTVEAAAAKVAARSAGERAAAVILPGTIRLSVGLDDVDDLIADIQSALSETTSAVAR